jgi:hypothetical protein
MQTSHHSKRVLDNEKERQKHLFCLGFVLFKFNRYFPPFLLSDLLFMCHEQIRELEVIMGRGIPSALLQLTVDPSK